MALATPIPTATTILDRWEGSLSRVAARPAVVVVALTAAGLLLRVFRLDGSSLSFDESMNWWISAGGFGEAMSRNAALNSYPPLYALLLTGVMQLGSSEIALRSIASVAGVACIPAIYALANQFTGRGSSLFAALLLTIAPSQVEYSREVRVYELSVLLAIALLWATKRFLDRPGSRNAVSLGLALMLAVITHYGLGILAAGLGIVGVATLWQQRASLAVWLQWLGAQAVGLITVILAVLPTLRTQLAAGAGGVSARESYVAEGFFNGSLRSAIHLATFQTFRILELAFPTAVMAFLVLLGLATFRADRRHRQAALFFLVPMVVTFAAAMAHRYPYLGERQDLFLTPMIYVVAALGFCFLATPGPGRRAAFVAGLLLAGYGLWQDELHARGPGLEPVRPIVEELERRLHAGDKIYVYSSRAFDYYSRYQPHERVLGIQPDEDSLRAFAQFDTVARAAVPAWLVFSHISDETRERLIGRVPETRRVQVVLKLGDAALYKVE